MVVAGDPEAMREFVSRARDARDDAETAYDSLVSALRHLNEALPVGFVVPAAPSVSELITVVADIDDYVGTVADTFEEAGTTNDGVTYTLDDAVLAEIPFETQYSQAERDRLRVSVEAELATLRERIRRGDADQTTAGELAAAVDLMRHLVETSSDPQAEAARLIDTMGPRDLHESLNLLALELGDSEAVRRSDWPIVAIEDLGFVVSLGLEGQPGRANRWAGVVHDPDWVPQGARARAEDPRAADAFDILSRDERLALLGAVLAPGTADFGMALFDPLWQADGLPDGGVVDQLFGTTEPLVPILTTAVTPGGAAGAPANPQLANDIVDHLLPDHFEDFFATPSSGDPNWHSSGYGSHDVPNALLGQVLATSVHPSLPDADRGALARAITDHYVELMTAENLVLTPYYPPEVLQGMAATTQPLLEGWRGRHDRRIVVDGIDPFSDDNLWTAVGLFGNEDGGAAGLGEAIRGMTTARLVDGAELGLAQPGEGAGFVPFRANDLDTLGEVYQEVAQRVSGERFRAVVEEVESGESFGTEPWTRNLLTGFMGEFPVGGDAAGALIDAIAEAQGQQLTSEGDPIAGAEAQMIHDLIQIDLVTHPELTHADLIAAVARAEREGGPAEVARMLYPDLYPAEGNGGEALTALRQLVNAQKEQVNFDVAYAIAGLTEGTD